MNTYAYDAHLPCKNPNCHSYGKPHPNCKCYSGMAEGGDVHFCSQARPHQKDCQYFAEGGDTPPTFEQAQALNKSQATEGASQPTDGLPPTFEEAQKESQPPSFEEAQAADGLSPNTLGPSATAALGLPKEGAAEQALAGAESFAGGATGDLSNVALDKLGISTEKERKERREKYPYVSGAGQAAGNLALFAAMPELALGEGAAAKIGGKAISGILTSMGYQGTNEISRAMLADPNDPTADHEGAAAAVAGRIGAAGLLGLGVGAGSGLAKQGLQAIGEAAAGSKMASALAGAAFGSKLKALSPEELSQLAEAQGWNEKAFKTGADLLNGGINKALGKFPGQVVGSAVSHIPIVGYSGGRLVEKAINSALGPKIEELTGKAISKTSQNVIIPAVLKAMSAGETSGLWKLMDHAANAGSGAQMIESAIENTLKAGGQQAIEPSNLLMRNEALKDFIENGGVDQALKDAGAPFASEPSSFAEGGEILGKRTSTSGMNTDNKKMLRKNDDWVAASSAKNPTTTKSLKNIKPPTHDQNIIPNADSPPDPVATLYPRQSQILNTTKARISSYLNSVRPQEPQGLPFDKKFKDPEKERSYDRAIEIANQPLSILNHIKSGQILPEHVSHFNNMYPELSQHLQKKLTEKIIASQMEKDHEKPSHHVIQGLSMFLGAPLDSTLTPQNIMAAQNVFASQAITKQMAQGPQKKNKSTLTKMSDNFLTPNEASIKRRNNV